jgi:hypothetical protein
MITATRLTNNMLFSKRNIKASTQYGKDDTKEFSRISVILLLLILHQYILLEVMYEQKSETRKKKYLLYFIHFLGFQFAFKILDS